MNRGKFIVFEGIDGSGKSTQVRRLAERLQREGLAVHRTAEPTASPVGMLIRNAFSGRITMDNRTIAALFAADRIDHLTNSSDGILGLLDRGVHVISDRYHLSSYAYHSSDVGEDWVMHANAMSTDLLRPDLTVYLDLSPEDAVRRIGTSRVVTDRFEEFERLQSARTIYMKMVRSHAHSDNILSLSATLPQEVLSESVWDAFVGITGTPCGSYNVP